MAPAKKKNGYKMPEPIPNGEILEDKAKKQWKLGPSIGKGGFGEIYSAQEHTGTKKTNAMTYVIKIEPHTNGPLFVEMHVYMRIARSADVEEFKTERNCKSLGMPTFIASGSHEYKGEKYRFIVMERFGSDIWKLFLENNKRFPAPTIFKIGLQVLDVLEYIHSKGYAHADIKGANLLLGSSKSTQNQVYLVDFGLAAHFSVAKQFKPDPKKAHNGTIEYLSTDAHLGVLTRRGDLEILVYNLIQWFGCKLPWEKDLSNCKTVQESKQNSLKDIAAFTKSCFGTNDVPDAIVQYLEYLSTLEFNTEPNYEALKKILLSGLKASGGTLLSPLNFKGSPLKRKGDTSASATPEKRKKATRVDSTEEEVDVKKPIPKRGKKKTVAKNVENGEGDANDIENSEVAVKRSRKKKIVTEPPQEAEVFTAEMLLYKKKLADKKSKKSKPTTVLEDTENSPPSPEALLSTKQDDGNHLINGEIPTDDDEVNNAEMLAYKKKLEGKKGRRPAASKKSKPTTVVEDTENAPQSPEALVTVKQEDENHLINGEIPTDDDKESAEDDDEVNNAEMLAYKKKLEGKKGRKPAASKKKKSNELVANGNEHLPEELSLPSTSSSGRPGRNRKVVNYTEA